MTFWAKHLYLGLLLCPLVLAPAHAQLRGHGGPVKALAISPDGTHAIRSHIGEGGVARPIVEEVRVGLVVVAGAFVGKFY